MLRAVAASRTGPTSCSTRTAALHDDIRALAPPGHLRMSDNPHANGGLLLKDLRLPDFRDYAVDVPVPGGSIERGAARAGRLADRRHPAQPGQLPDLRPRRDGVEPAAVGVPDARTSSGTREFFGADVDEHLARAGRVLEMLSEHQCQGWLEGYLLTGRHGLFNCYEAFIHIIDSMFNQHAKWLKVTNDIPWRRPDREPELPAVQPRLAPGPQRLQPPGPGVHRPRGQQEGRGRPRLPAAGRQHAAVDVRPLPAQPAVRQRGRRGQAAGAELPDHGPGDRALHARSGHLGLGGLGGARARSRTSCSAARATCRRSRCWRRRTSCAASCPT